MPVKATEDGLKVLFGNKRKIRGRYPYQYLVHVEDKGRYQLIILKVPNQGPGLTGLQERFDVQVNVPVLQGPDGLRMYNAGTVISELNGIQVRDPVQLYRIIEPF